MTQLASSSLDHSVMIWNFKPQLRAFRFVGHKVEYNGIYLYTCRHPLRAWIFHQMDNYLRRRLEIKQFDYGLPMCITC